MTQQRELPKSRAFIQEAVVALFRRQEADEQMLGNTRHQNGIGYNAVDAAFGTQLARRVVEGRSLTRNQLNAAYRMLKKYRVQLEAALDFDAYTDDPVVPQDLDGLLDYVNGRMIFLPTVYPTTQAGQSGFSWDRENGWWHRDVNVGAANALRGIWNVEVTERLQEQLDLTPESTEPEAAPRPKPWEAKPGWVQYEADRDTLVFWPKTYPTTQCAQQGWKYKKQAEGGKAWEHAASIGAVHHLAELFPGLRFHPSVFSWMRSATSPTIPEAVRESDLFPYQQEGAAVLLNAKRAMLSLAPGLGKTATSLIASKAGGYKRILVVAPLSLLMNWRKETASWFPEAEAHIWHGAMTIDSTDSLPADKPFFAITNYETVKKYQSTFENWGFDLMICDESIMIKNRKAKRSKTIYDVAQAISSVWLLTGSPASRFLDDMWHQLKVIDRQRFSSYWRFAEQYCLIEKNHWGQSVIANKAQAPEWLKRDLADIYFARTQEVLDLPDWIFDTVEVAMGASQANFYRAVEQDMLLAVGDADRDDVLLSNVLQQITRSIQAASNPSLIQDSEAQWNAPDVEAKWTAAIEMLEFEELPAIIWTNFIETGRRIATKLEAAGYRVGILTGQTPAAERQDVVDRFQDGDLDIIIAHPKVGKFGFTLTRARTAIYLERSYDGDDFYQSLHRVRRIGTEHSPHVVFVLATYPNGDPTIDHVIHSVLNYRTETSRRLTAGDLTILQ